MNLFRRIIYQPTLRCNCNCKMCGQSRYFSEEECDCRFIQRRIMESNFYLTGGKFSITGGEPFLKTGLPEMLSDIVNAGNNPVDITTNGICTEAIETFIKRLHNFSRLDIHISIDGMPEAHNAIRGNPQAFEKVIQTARFLREYNVPFIVNTVIGPDNIRDIDGFADFLSQQIGGGVKWRLHLFQII